MSAEDPAFDPDRPVVQQALTQLEAALGGREALVEVLSVVDDPEVEYLVGLIADPRETDTTLGELCRRGNVTPGRLLRAYKSASGAKSQVEAIREVNQALPNVARDVVRRARTHRRICPKCHGKKEVMLESAPAVCPTCQGSGKILADGSIDHQKLTLEMAGLLVKGSGTHVQVGVNVQGSHSQTTLLPFGKLQQAVQQVLQQPRPQLSQGPTIDADFVQAQER